MSYAAYFRIPLKQGLRPLMLPSSIVTNKYFRIPLKQGLRLRINSACEAETPGIFVFH